MNNVFIVVKDRGENALNPEVLTWISEAYTQASSIPALPPSPISPGMERAWDEEAAWWNISISHIHAHTVLSLQPLLLIL